MNREIVVSRTDNAEGAEVCREPGCGELVALDGAGDTGQCARHRQLARAGVCPSRKRFISSRSSLVGRSDLKP